MNDKINLDKNVESPKSTPWRNLEEACLTIVGVGLISGSFALALKDKGYAKKIIGVSRTKASAEKAKELGIIDEALAIGRSGKTK